MADVDSVRGLWPVHGPDLGLRTVRLWAASLSDGGARGACSHVSGPLPVRPSGIFISATRTARRAGAAALRPVLNPMVRLTARYKGIAATRLRVGSFDVREVGA